MFRPLVQSLDEHLGGESDPLLEFKEDLMKQMIIIVGAPASGKCVLPSTKVFSGRGLVEVGSLAPGGWENVGEDSYVEVSGGIQSSVGDEGLSHFYRGPKKRCSRVLLGRGFCLEAARTHPVLSVRDGSLVWSRVEDLNLGDLVALRAGGQTFPKEDAELPECSFEPAVRGSGSAYGYKPVRFPGRMTPDLAEWLAWIVGEGSLTGLDNVVGFTNADPLVVGRMRSLTEDLFGLDLSKLPSAEIQYSVYSKPMKHWLAQLGVSGLSHEKVVPDCVLRSTAEVQSRFLAAFFEAEGSIDSLGHVELSSASESVIEILQLMLLNFGVVCGRHPRVIETERWGARTYHRISFSGRDTEVFKNVSRATS